MMGLERREGRVQGCRGRIPWLICVGILTLLVSMSALELAGQDTRRKLSGPLLGILESFSDGLSAAMSYGRTQGVEIREDERIVVVVEGPGNLEPLVRAFGGVVEARYKSLWQVNIPLRMVTTLAANASIWRVGLPQAASTVVRTPTFVGEGVKLEDAVALVGVGGYHDMGHRGDGVKVAVIDVGFAGLEGAIAAGVFPADIRERARDFTQDRNPERGGDHGTAVAEIIQAVAPEAELYLYRVSKHVELLEAMGAAIDAGARIINHSVAWHNMSYYDGGGQISEMTRDATSHGVFWVNAAGNYAEHHYEAVFRDENGDGYHDEVIVLDASKVGLATRLAIHMTWDAWPVTGENFDLFLARAERTVRSSTNPQSRDNPTEPVEAIHHTVITPEDRTEYQLRVKWVGEGSPPENRRFKLFVSASPDVILRPYTSAASLIDPAPAPHIFAVGAGTARLWDFGQLESYSSRGPTTDGRVKPDLVAPSPVETVTMGGLVPGTSAAAPFVAGMAALLLSENPDLSVDAISSMLRDRAWPVSGASPNHVGAGRAQLVRPPVPNLAIASVRVAPIAVAPGEPVTVTVSVRNTGDGPASPSWLALKDVERVGVALAERRLSELPAGEEHAVTLSWVIPEDTEGGTLRLSVVADFYHEVDEWSRDDNRREFDVRVELPRPGLTVEPYRLEAIEVTEGEGPVDHVLTVENSGGTDMEWEVHTSAAWIRAEPDGGTLARGGRTSVRIRVDSQGLGAGEHEYSLTVKADGAEGSPRTVEGALLVKRPANLAIAEAKVEPTVTAPGERVTITVTVNNDGDRPANPSWLVLEDAERSGVALAEQRLPELQAGQEHEVTLSWRVPEDTRGGTLRFSVVADFYHEVDEWSRADNRREFELRVELPRPDLTVEPHSLDPIEVTEGEGPAERALSLANTGGSDMEWEVLSSTMWIRAEPDGGTLARGERTNVAIRVDVQGLEAGDHEFALVVTAQNAAGSPRTVRGIVRVRRPPVVDIAPSSFSFRSELGAGDPRPERLNIRNAGDQRMTWTVTADAAWVALNPVQGQLGPGDSISVEVGAQLEGLAAGTHTATVTLDAPEAQGSPADIPISLSIGRPLRITAVDLPARIPADGTEVTGTVQFSADHHVERATFDVISAEDFKGFAFNPKEDAASYRWDRTTGEGVFGFKVFSYIEQQVVIAVQLHDAQDNVSVPVEVTLEMR